MTQTAPFPTDPRLTQISLAYKNTSLIADALLPRIQVPKKEFRWTKHTKAEGFTVPDTTVGRKGRPNQISFTGTEESSFCYDYGLEDPIPSDDIDAAAGVPGMDPLGKSSEFLTNLIMLDREIRVAAMLTATATYGSGNFDTLGSQEYWDDYSNSDPVDQILDAIDTRIIRPNTFFMGRSVFTALRKHPKVVAAVFANGGNADKGGMVSRQQLGELFELNVIVGEGWYNTAKPGQTASLSRVWGESAGLLYINPVAAPNRDITFGFTAQYGSKIASATPDRNIGLRGGQVVRVGESVREVVCAADVGFLFDNVLS